MAGTRLAIMVAIALPVILLAPFTYTLTKVYRSPLPVDAIQALDDTLSFELPLRFYYRSPERMADIRQWMQAMPELFPNFSSSDAKSPLTYRVHHEVLPVDDQDVSDVHEMDEVLRATLLSRWGPDDLEYSFFFDCTDLDIDEHKNKWVMGKYRHAWTRNCDHTSSLAQLQQLFGQLFPSPDHVETTVAPRYRLTFSLLNENPQDHVAQWDFAQLAQDYLLDGFVRKLSILADFTLDSQILHFANLSRTMVYDDLARVRCLTTNDLQQFMSANDWLTTTILNAQERNLNFLAYVPSPARAPVVIAHTCDGIATTQTHTHRAFLIPGWGGLAVHPRPPSPNATTIDSDEFQPTVAFFVAHARELLGLREANGPSMFATFLPSPADGVADWELDALARAWLARVAKSTRETLRSIVTLIETMPQMRVRDRIRVNVQMALDELAQLPRGHLSIPSYPAALARARQAMVKADAAYYDPTMVPQLYFPEEHLYAVYLPLLFPLTMPLFAGLVREYQRYREKQKVKRTKEKEE